MNETRKPNRLINETSPYLQQHAYNPVDWYPWGEEAIAKAKRLDRPIFLSVGYSSCHWCHVMERESFENEEIARLMNDKFVNVKVDREERPDIDSIYMNAVQMLTGSGGWPMSVFLTPDLFPFWGGTYFPPDSRLGRPGFDQILTQIDKHYKEQRGKVEEAATSITRELRRHEEQDPASELPSEAAIENAARQSSGSFDEAYGGFGPAPKFPRSVELSVLLRWQHDHKDQNALAQCEKTLDCMALGGIYDQVGGGFHRYSTDRKWLVPHFEKMLYDNALLVKTYVEAYQVTGHDLYRRVVEEVLDYVLREMTAPDGGFYSATDADSEGEEGKFFVWTPAQVAEALGEEDARIFCAYYNITAGGNFEHTTSIPNITASIDATAQALSVDPGVVRRVIIEGRSALYAKRAERESPFRDEKVITAWNGLMIGAFARAYQVLGEDRYLSAATKAAEFVLSNLRDGETLYRTFKDGRAQHPAYLDDYAYLSEALVDLYEAGFDLEKLTAARQLTDRLLDSFWDSDAGGFFYTANDHENLICRQKQYLDNATPSGNGVAALTLLRLERLTGEGLYRERAEQALQSAKRFVDRAPSACSSTLIALDFLLQGGVEIAIVGGGDGEGQKRLLQAIHSGFVPRRVIAVAPENVSESYSTVVPLLEGKRASESKATAFVCRDFACREPTTNPEVLARQLVEAFGG